MVNSTFGSDNVEKLTFGSKNVQNTSLSKHFWTFRCRKMVRNVFHGIGSDIYFDRRNHSIYKLVESFVFAFCDHFERLQSSPPGFQPDLRNHKACIFFSTPQNDCFHYKTNLSPRPALKLRGQ